MAVIQTLRGWIDEQTSHTSSTDTTKKGRKESLSGDTMAFTRDQQFDSANACYVEHVLTQLVK